MKSQFIILRLTYWIIPFLLMVALIFGSAVNILAVNITPTTGNWSATAWPNTYRTGTISTSTGSAIVTGTGTLFITEISVGNIIKTTGNVVIGTVASVASNTSLILTSNAVSSHINISFNFQGIGSGDDLYIPTSGVNVTITMDVDGTCNSITSARVNNNTSLTITNSGSPHTLTMASVGNIDVTNGTSFTVIINANTTLTCNNIDCGHGSGTGTFVFVINGTLKNSGYIQTTTGTITLTCNTGSTVEYNGPTQEIYPATYYDLTLSGNAIKIISGTTTINGTLSIPGTSKAALNTILPTANKLKLAGAYQVSGTWGSNHPACQATNKNNTYFDYTYSGYLTVTNGCTSGYWTGGTSTNWNESTNWCSGVIPGATTDVIIASGGNQPVIGLTGGLCRDITISSGATLTITGSYSLTISGNWTNNGGTLTPNTSTVTFNGTGKIIGGTSSTTFYDVSFGGSASLSTGVATIINHNLSIGNGTTFTAAGFALTITGTTTVGGGTSGNLTISSSTGSKLFTGLVSISAGGTWNNSGNSAIEYRGGITKNPTGTFTTGSGAQYFTTNSQALSGTFSIPNITVTDVILTNNNTLTVSNALSGTGGLSQAISATLDVGGNSGITTLIATGSNNTVIYSGSSQTVKSTTYHNLILSGSGINTIISTTVNGILSMEGTATVSAAPTYGSSATLQYNAATSRTSGLEWITPFEATGGIIIANTGTVSLNESKVLNASVQLTINSGAVLTIGYLYELTVNGSIANYSGTSGLIIRSASDGDGKLINNSPNVASTVELYLSGGETGGRKFHFFVPPVSLMTIYTTSTPLTDNAGILETRTALSLNSSNFNGDLLSYSESAAGANQHNGWLYFDGYVPSGSSFSSVPFSYLASSKGYNIYLKQDDPVTFKGTLNATEHIFTLNKSSGCLGWNLVGNPYPCNYDLTGIVTLTTPDNGVDKTIYIIKGGTYVYKIVGGVGIGWNTDIIPPMQGFFVHATTTGKSLVLPVSKKTSSASESRAKGSKSGEAELSGLIRLILSNGTSSDETVVCLHDKASIGFDGDVDAYKLFGSSTTVPYIYTELGSVKYAINSVHGPVSEPVIIPVTVVLKSQGTYRIDISEFENLDGINVVLRHGSIMTNLGRNASYSFTSAAGTFTGFELIIGGTATTVDNLTSVKLKTWYSNNFMYINCPAEIIASNSSLIIYDMQGKPVSRNNQLYIIPGETIQLPLFLQIGVYFMSVVVNNQPYVSKIVVL